MFSLKMIIFYISNTLLRVLFYLYEEKSLIKSLFVAGLARKLDLFHLWEFTKLKLVCHDRLMRFNAFGKLIQSQSVYLLSGATAEL